MRLRRRGKRKNQDEADAQAEGADGADAKQPEADPGSSPTLDATSAATNAPAPAASPAENAAAPVPPTPPVPPSAGTQAHPEPNQVDEAAGQAPAKPDQGAVEPGQVPADPSSADPDPDPPRAPVDPTDPDSIRAAGEPLVAGLDRHVNGLREHSDRVAILAEAVAREMGQAAAEARIIGEAARLHAVGKVYLDPEFVAQPRTELLQKESEHLESHFELGHRLAAGAGVPESLCVWILHAREHWDGSGATGLKESDIPAASQIIRAACEFDAAHRGVATRLWRGEAREIGLNRLRKLVGTVFGADVVAALTTALKRLETEGDGAVDPVADQD